MQRFARRTKVVIALCGQRHIGAIDPGYDNIDVEHRQSNSGQTWFGKELPPS
jgi:hypothetical protein